MTQIRKHILSDFWRTIKLCSIVSLCIGLIYFIINPVIESALIFALISAMYWFFMAFGSSLISSLLELKFDWIKHTSKRMIWSTIINSIYIIIAVISIDIFIIKVFENADINLLFSSNHIWKNIFIILFSILITSMYYASFFMKYWRLAIIRQEELEKENMATRYEALKAQTDPHFFFNSLNVLSSLVDEDKEMAQKFIKELANIYRYVLEQKDNEMSTISEEISFIEKYVFLQKIRFENGIFLNINISDDDLNKKTISLALQILFENIFKHNAISEEFPIYINISSRDNYLIVENNINNKRTKPLSNKIGLENIKARYSFFTEEKVIIEHTEDFFRVKLPLLRS